MLGELSRLIAMVGVTAKHGIRAAIHDRVKTGKCILPGCECRIAARGLCNKHYVAFIRELQSRPKKERPEFETAAIREGKVLASQEMRQIRSPNPFADL